MKKQRRRIYLDHNATRPVDPGLAKSLQILLERSDLGNPSSDHQEGKNALRLLDEAKDTFFGAIGAKHARRELLFTASATEANQLAILGFLQPMPYPRRRKLLCSAVEHKSVLDAMEAANRMGAAVELIRVNSDGRIDLDALGEHIERDSKKIVFVSCMAANNETGVIQPVEEIGRLLRKYPRLIFHVDASQAPGKMPLDIARWNADLITFSGHKIGAPVGVGALYIANQKLMMLRPLAIGGGQQLNIRGGTIPVLLAHTLSIAMKNTMEDGRHGEIANMRDRFEAILQERLNIDIVGQKAPRLSNTSLCLFPENLKTGGEPIAKILDQEMNIAATGKSACLDEYSTSHVLAAMEFSKEEADRAVRFSFGPQNVMEDALEAAERIVRRLRQKRAPR
jgi:cysteine desulfurase